MKYSLTLNFFSILKALKLACQNVFFIYKNMMNRVNNNRISFSLKVFSFKPHNIKRKI